jgi:hypothetical protein
VALSSAENSLTLEVLPWALRKWKLPDKVTAGDGLDMDTPVFVRKLSHSGSQYLFGTDIEVWFNPALLSEAWRHEHHGQVEKRTTTEAGFRDQAQALDGKSKRVKVTNSGGRLAYYYQLTGPVAQQVINRAISRGK